MISFFNSVLVILAMNAKYKITGIRLIIFKFIYEMIPKKLNEKDLILKLKYQFTNQLVITKSYKLLIYQVAFQLIHTSILKKIGLFLFVITKIK